jgi:FAD synthetase
MTDFILVLRLQKIGYRLFHFIDKKDARAIIRKGLETYGEGLALSFNGGKDCTVLLDLFHKERLNDGLHNKIKVLYCCSQSEQFQEIESFVNDCKVKYSLDMHCIQAPMKQALQQFLSECPEIKAILIGTRRTDPYSSNYTVFMPTDKDWPSVMRIHPLIDWEYQDIWQVIKYLEIPYCELYDRGYTSLGTVLNTLPNPVLIKDRDALEANAPKADYLPGYLLMNSSDERKGRLK